MSEASWQLHDVIANLRVARSAPGSPPSMAEACVDLARPAVGLHHVRISDAAFNAAQLLGVELPGELAKRAEQVGADVAANLDAYVRQGDLVATYERYAAQPLRTQVYWRALPDVISDNTAAAIDLVVSVQTQLLDSDPSCLIVSEFKSAEVLRLPSAAGPLAVLAVAEHGCVDIRAESGAGCFIARWPDKPWSYVEMVHPADFCHSRLESRSAAGGTEARLTLTHRLFPQRLEKGVILRGRVRGLFVRRSTDEPTVRAHYERFAAAEPPLTV